MALIYIASPYSKGDVCENVRYACLSGDAIVAKGHQVFIPHLYHLWNIISPKPYEEWLRISRVWMSYCDALLKLGGESVGADLEVAEAKRLCMPIYYSLEDVPDLTK